MAPFMNDDALWLQANIIGKLINFFTKKKEIKKLCFVMVRPGFRRR